MRKSWTSFITIKSIESYYMFNIAYCTLCTSIIDWIDRIKLDKLQYNYYTSNIIRWLLICKAEYCFGGGKSFVRILLWWQCSHRYLLYIFLITTPLRPLLTDWPYSRHVHHNEIILLSLNAWVRGRYGDITLY